MIPKLRPSFVCLTNIPSPYRLYEFELLNSEFRRRNIDFEVIFMAPTEPGRHWQFKPKDWSFKSSIAWGLHPKWSTMAFHLNPGTLIRLLNQPVDWLLVGGGWMIPTVAILSILSNKFLSRTIRLFWVEASLSYTKYSRSGWPRFLRQSILSSYDGFVVPGQSSVAYLQDLLGDQGNANIRLANFVDEYEFNNRVEQLRQHKKILRSRLKLGEEIVLLCPARFIPEKGILEFLTATADLPMSKYTLLLAGDGPLHQTIATFINDTGMHHVKLLGHQNHDALLELYALSDAMLLPSLREPYGFVAVEALWAGLPLLLSTEVGAVPEVIDKGKNGWCFNPQNRTEICRVIQNVLDAGRADLKEMGSHSKKIAQHFFVGSQEACSFVDNLLEYFPSRYK